MTCYALISVKQRLSILKNGNLLKNALKLLLLIIFLLLSDMQVFGQIPWTKDPNNPVLSGGSGGAWYQHALWPAILYNADSTRYEMWFCGSAIQSTSVRPLRIGFATSPDGINWSVHPTPVLDLGNAGEWDEFGVEEPRVLRENGQYKMWYSSGTFNGTWKVGYATSLDGIIWTKDTLNNPVMVSNSDAWQVKGLSSPHTLSINGEYKMWFTGWAANWDRSSIGLATSPDGINWTQDTLNSPVLTAGDAGRWDDHHVTNAQVLLIDTVFHMWYSGARQGESESQAGWATSTDGIHWDKYNDISTTSTLYIDSDPVLKLSPGQWDGNRIDPATVILEGDSLLRMWYTGFRSPISTYLWRIGHATAPFSGLIVGIQANDDSHNPEQFSLLQNYPNPFNPGTTIEFSLPKSDWVTLKIFNILGQEVAVLVSENLSAGSYKYDWAASGLASGVYYYRLDAGEFNQTKKLLLLK